MTVTPYTPESWRIIHEAKVDFRQRVIQSMIHIVQYDKSLPIIEIKLYSDGKPWELPGNVTDVRVRWGKRDHTYVHTSILGYKEGDRSTVYLEIIDQMTVFYGEHNPVLEVFIGEDKIACSSYIPFYIDRNPVQNSDIESEITPSVIDELKELIAEKQDELVPGENIKNINGESIMGSGNIELPTIEYVEAHINDTNNPHHVTKDQLNLENVVNTGDSNEPVQFGTTKFTTGGAYALKTGLETAINTHTQDTNNPHHVTKDQLNLENVVNTGDSNEPVQFGTTKFTTGGAYALKTGLETAINTHTQDTNNPHHVTKDQLNLENVVNTGDSNEPVQFGTTKFTTGGAYALKTGLETAINTHTQDTNNPHHVTKDQLNLENVDNKSEATIKSDFTGSVATGNTGFVTGDAVKTYVDTAIDNLPEPMIFKGTLGTGGTITSLPTASSANEGFTYKVITAGTYASQAAKVGDVFVSNGSEWAIIPAGDVDSDTWREIKVNGTSLLGSGISTGAVNFKSGTNVTVSGSGNDITISSSYTDTGATSIGTVGSGNVINGASYDASTRKITLSKGITALTFHQAIKNLDTTATTAQSTNASEAISGSGKITLHKVAKTGTYSDLIGTPSIPDSDSDLTNDRYVRYDTASQGLSDTQKSNARTNIGAGTGNGSVTSVRVQAGTGLSSSQSTAQTGTLDTTISVASGYKLPTTTEWNGKQATLVSGTNIKTINSTSLLGSGNIDITGHDINIVSTLPTTPEDDAIYLANTNASSAGGIVELPVPAASDAGKAFLVNSTGAIVLGTIASGGGVTETTWSALKAMRDGGTLTPGAFYRITDYQCTTSEENTSSANHQFDIIVLALENNKLSEEAWAAHHAGDTYFANSNLSAWQLWYCIDNDTTRFKWADSTNGKGVIYRMIDEFSNDIPYDFKNILLTSVGKYTDAYTFSYTEDSTIKDASLLGFSKGCYSNIMKCFIKFGTNEQAINFNVFYSTSTTFNCYANIFSRDCFTNTFSVACYSNTFGYHCADNSFGDGCSDNTFGHNCTYITFGNNCYSNTFGNNCYSNTFGNNCYSNTFGSDCYFNTFGDNCDFNTFGDKCHSNTFGIGCEHNTFGNNCHSNAFRNNCYSNTFRNNCYSNTFRSDCYSNTFGDNCDFNTFGTNCSYNSFGNYCTYNTFGTSSLTIGYCRYIVLDNNCEYLYINSADTSMSASNYLQNVHIHLGVSGSSSSDRKTITVPDRNLAYSTDYYAHGSQTVILDA